MLISISNVINKMVAMVMSVLALSRSIDREDDEVSGGQAGHDHAGSRQHNIVTA